MGALGRVDRIERAGAAPTQATADAASRTEERPGAAPRASHTWSGITTSDTVPAIPAAFARAGAARVRRGNLSHPSHLRHLSHPPHRLLPVWDWESLLGVRGAAWLGGITLVIAALFFARWSIEQGFFTPVIRIGIMLLAGDRRAALGRVEAARGVPDHRQRAVRCRRGRVSRPRSSPVTSFTSCFLYRSRSPA